MEKLAYAVGYDFGVLEEKCAKLERAYELLEQQNEALLVRVNVLENKVVETELEGNALVGRFCYLWIDFDSDRLGRIESYSDGLYCIQRQCGLKQIGYCKRNLFTLCDPSSEHKEKHD